MFYRLIKPLWGQDRIYKDGKWVKNPDMVKIIKGPNIIEGCFDEEFLAKKNKIGYNIYWFPNHPSSNVYTEEKKYLNGRDVDVFKYVFVDMDLKDGVYKTKEDFLENLKKFPLKPTMTVNSGNGVHAYWAISDLDRDTYCYMQMGLIEYFQTDPSIYTVLQLMRYPGYKNTKKHDKFKEVTLYDELCSGSEYTCEQLLQPLYNISEEGQNAVQRHLDKLDGKISVQIDEDVNLDELPDKFVDLLEKDQKIYDLFHRPVETYGDRSGADLALANMLFRRGFNIKEAVKVIGNSKKAIAKGIYRFEYARATVERAYKDNQEPKFTFVTADQVELEVESEETKYTNGPEFFDCLETRWQKGDILGLIAHTGVGKTTIALKIIKDMIQNNPDNDDLYVFFSLEMAAKKIIARWLKLVGKKSKLTSRLIVISNLNDDRTSKEINLQDIVAFCDTIRQQTGKDIGAVAIDHLQEIRPLIDMRRKPTFGAESEISSSGRRQKVLSDITLCKQLRPLVNALSTFLIVLNQTTKERGGEGDIPLGVSAAYGSSNFEKICDYIITCWQPLRRVYHLTDLRVLAWQYAKIREQGPNDAVTVYRRNLLRYDGATGELDFLQEGDQDTFNEMIQQAEEARKNDEKKVSKGYHNSPKQRDLSALKVKLLKKGV